MRTFWGLVLGAIVLLVSLVTHAKDAALAPAQRMNVLVLTAQQIGLPVPDSVHRGILAALKEGGVSVDNIFIEHLDLYRSPGKEHKDNLALMVRTKYVDKHIGLVVVFGGPAIDFMSREINDLFPNAALLKLAEPGPSGLDNNPRKMIDVRWSVDVAGTLRAALQLFPATRRVFVVTGQQNDSNFFINNAKVAAAPFMGKLDFEYTAEMTYEEMLKRCGSLEPDSIVIYAPYFLDKTGRSFVPAEVLQRINQTSSAPVFAMLEAYMGQGIVGGSLLRTETVGKQVGKIALDYLDGRLQLVKPVTSFDIASQMMFDWKAMTRWGANTAYLPPDSIVINRPLTLWGQYKEFVLLSALAIIVLSLLSVALLIQNRQRRLAEDRFRILIEQAPEAILVFDLDTRLVVDVNPSAEKLLAYPRDELLKSNLDLLYTQTLRDAESAQHRVDERVFRAMAGDAIETEHTIHTGDGRTLICEARLVRLPAAYRKLLRVSLIDVTQRKQADERIQYLALHDVLTGLPNRTQLDERTTIALGLAHRNHQSVAMMFLDLDHFKYINDTLGHSIGDALLIQLAQRFSHILRDGDTVSRLGGDEFIFLMTSVDAHGASVAAQKVLDIVSKPFEIEQYDLNVTGSIGIAMYPGDGENLESLFQSADSAMYRAKQEGRNGYCFFTAEMRSRSARQLQLVNALRHALEREQLFLHYQPQLSIDGERVIGAEALLRWTHPELGAVSPAEFIPAAEDSGLILNIGEWILRQAVRQATQWMVQGLAPMVTAVNLSSVQFRHPDLPHLVSQILLEEGLPPEYLELELTEGVAMHDPQGAITIMNNLHERGIRMSIDDFGTGFSSLNYLKKFKVYKLKIDQSFVRDISTDSEDKAIVGAIIHMAKSLGLQTIAEGVETTGQLDFLRQQGCHEVQGYHFSKPLPAGQFEAFVRARK